MGRNYSLSSNILGVITILIVAVTFIKFGQAFVDITVYCNWEGCDNKKDKGDLCSLHYNRYVRPSKSYGSYSASAKTKNSKSGIKQNSTKSSSYSYSTDSYDNGYDDVYYNDDYDWDRYYSDDDYASGVDDAMEDVGGW